MSSPVQFEYFKFLYEHERHRHIELINRGKVYLSIITLYMGLLAMGADKTIARVENSLPLILIYISSLFFIISALADVIFAIGIYTNEKPSDPEVIINRMDDTVTPDQKFIEDRIIDFAVATNRNSANNDKRAGYLRYSTYLLLLGILCQAVLVTLIFITLPEK